jgi:hypothetical protein
MTPRNDNSFQLTGSELSITSFDNPEPASSIFWYQPSTDKVRKYHAFRKKIATYCGSMNSANYLDDSESEKPNKLPHAIEGVFGIADKGSTNSRGF